MKAVWKYEFSFDDQQSHLMPRDAEILFFGNQNEMPCLWVRVELDPRAEDKTLRTFIIRGTGHPDADGKYIGTALFNGGNLVFHCFETT